MIFRSILESEVERWASHCGEVFINDGPGYFLRHYRLDPWRDPLGIFIAEENGEIASTVRVFSRKVYLNGEAVKMGGIGEVSTKEKYRRQGLSAKLLSIASEYMCRQDFPISTLFASYYSHYEKHGYQRTRRSTARIALNDVSPQSGLTLRAAKQGDVSSLVRIYENSAKGFNGPLVRDDAAYWSGWVLQQAKDLTVLEKGGEIVAYALLQDAPEKDGQPKALAVQELCAAQSARDLLPFMLETLRLRAGAEQIQMQAPLLGALPQGSYAVQSERESTDLMVHCLSPFDAGGVRVNDTNELLRLYDPHVFFDIDGF